MRTPRPGLADLSKTCIYAHTSPCLRCWNFYLAWLDDKIKALALKLAWNWLLRLYSMPKPTIPLSLWCKRMGMGMCPIFLFHCLVGPVDVTIVQVCLFTDQLSLHQKILKKIVYTFILSILLQRDWGGIANTDNCPWEPRLHLFDSSREVALPTFRDIQTLHSEGGDHWRLKYTEVQSQSQQMAFTRSPSLSNNPKILNSYLIFTGFGRYTYQWG